VILRLTAGVIERIRAHAARDLPREACGLILGPEADGIVVGDEAVASANLAPAGTTDAFEIDTALHLALQRRARAAGRRVVAVYHSHPAAPAIPSPRDAAGAWDESLIWVIIAAGRAEASAVRGWRPAGGLFTECVIEVVS
jgi:proteasome lid subunit RPN8/RPN11